ncbi:glycosyl transferase [Enterococcus florum]|uniref:Glycosyl transferase n=1 Tax=Enterococcus florum TaxID=2480627 RepID=A0A4P5PAL3_9ENTE|nr:glycosyltransferase family 4 protein [Enterococcus florum]GCF95137.1 glycosyl transferase [Enterococcus florum]
MGKILILSTGAKYTYQTRKELIRNLVEEGYEIELLCPYGSELDYFHNRGVRLHNIDFDNHGKNPIREFFLIFKLIKLIRKTNPIVILGFTIKMNIYGAFAARILNIPFVANITGLGTGFSTDLKLEKLLVKMYKFSFREVFHVFFQNEANQSYFVNKKILRGSHSVLAGSGINLEEFQLEPIVSKENREILFLSRIMKDKGIEEFLEAANIVKKSRKKCIFNIAGSIDNSYKESIRDHQKNSNVFYLGELDDVRNIIKRADVIVLPSYHEGMSNVLLEAAAMGRPVIASNIPGCKEIVRNGESGYLIPTKDVNALVGAVEKIIKKDTYALELMGKEGRKIVEERFDRKIIIIEYLKIIRTIIDEEDYGEISHGEFSSET